MAKEIPQDLKQFKDTMSTGLSSITSVTTNITSKINELVIVVNQVKESVGGAYKSSSDVNKAITKLSNSSQIINQMKEEINSTINEATSKSESEIQKVTELEQLLEKIEASESFIATERAKKEPDYSAISAEEAELNINNTKFDIIKTEGETLLKELMAMDKSVDVSSDSSNAPANTNSLNTYTDQLSNLKHGSFTTQYYTASNGVKVEYNIYIPDNAEGVEGLPVHIFLHGSGCNGKNALNTSLPELINNNKINPQGIVICPQAKTNSDFANPKWQAAFMEAVDRVVNETKADKNRISLSGYSNGGDAGYKLVQNYPNYFSAYVPIGASINHSTLNSDSLSRLNLWAFYGEKDGKVAIAKTEDMVDYLQACGASADLYLYEGEGHANVQYYTFERTFTDKNGRQVSVLDWAFNQVKS